MRSSRAAALIKDIEDKHDSEIESQDESNVNGLGCQPEVTQAEVQKQQRLELLLAIHRKNKAKVSRK